VTIAAVTTYPTQLSLLTTNAAPSAGQYYTLYGVLQTTNGTKLGNQPIYLQENVSGSWQYAVGPVYSAADGYYAFTWPAASEGTHEYRALYDEATGHGAVASAPVTEHVTTTYATQLTMQTTSTNPISGQQYTLYGILQASDGSKLANQPIYLQEYVEGGWQYAVGPVYTYPDGYYAFTWPAGDAGTHEYRALFDGATGYMSALSSKVTVVTSYPTQLSLLTTDAAPSVGQHYTLYGILQASGGTKLSNQPIYLQEKVGGSWQYAVGPVYSAADGYYAFTWPAAAGTHEYRALFDGATLYSVSVTTSVTETVT